MKVYMKDVANGVNCCVVEWVKRNVEVVWSYREKRIKSL